jgi:hypothetical protein
MVVDAAVAALIQLDVATAAGEQMDEDEDDGAAKASKANAAAQALAEAAVRVLSHVYTDVKHDIANKRLALRAGSVGRRQLRLPTARWCASRRTRRWCNRCVTRGEESKQHNIK